MIVAAALVLGPAIPRLASAAGSASWITTGNLGTNPSSNFVGTSDNQPLAFRTNNQEAMRINASGYVGIGTTAPKSKLDVENGNVTIGNTPGSSPGITVNASAAGPAILINQPTSSVAAIQAPSMAVGNITSPSGLNGTVNLSANIAGIQSLSANSISASSNLSANTITANVA